MQVKISVIDQAVMQENREVRIAQRGVEIHRLEREDLIEDLLNVRIIIPVADPVAGKVLEDLVIVEDLAMVEAIKSSILEDDLRLKRTLCTRGLIS